MNQLLTGFCDELVKIAGPAGNLTGQQFAQGSRARTMNYGATPTKLPYQPSPKISFKASPVAAAPAPKKRGGGGRAAPAGPGWRMPIATQKGAVSGNQGMSQQSVADAQKIKDQPIIDSHNKLVKQVQDYERPDTWDKINRTARRIGRWLVTDIRDM